MFEGCTVASNRILAEHERILSVVTENLGWDDWIPGDGGYIANKPIPQHGDGMIAAAQRRFERLEGENIVYVGNGDYYAWPREGLSKLDYLERLVAAWGALPGAQPGTKVRADYRRYPFDGLEAVKVLSQQPGMYLADTKDGEVPVAEENWMHEKGGTLKPYSY